MKGIDEAHTDQALRPAGEARGSPVEGGRVSAPLPGADDHEAACP